MVWRAVRKRGSVTVVVPVCPQSRLAGAPACGPFYIPALVSCIPCRTCVGAASVPRPRRAGRGRAAVGLGEQQHENTSGCSQYMLQVCIGPSGCHSEKPNCTVTMGTQLE